MYCCYSKNVSCNTLIIHCYYTGDFHFSLSYLVDKVSVTSLCLGAVASARLSSGSITAFFLYSVSNVFLKPFLCFILPVFIFYPFKWDRKTGGGWIWGGGGSYLPIAVIKSQDCVLMKSFCYGQVWLCFAMVKLLSLPGPWGDISAILPVNTW